MKNAAINLRDLVILVADPSPYLGMVTHSMLRGFGATKVLDVRSSVGVMMALTGQKVDILLCDAGLPPHGGLNLTQAIRRNTSNENRTLPIMLMCSDTRDSTVKHARDAGANMVIAKPMSPSSLYDRLAWIAFNPRKFVDTESYFGPDRRFKIEGYPGGVGRRISDQAVEIAAETGPAMAQSEIDNLLNNLARGG